MLTFLRFPYEVLVSGWRDPGVMNAEGETACLVRQRISNGGDYRASSRKHSANSPLITEPALVNAFPCFTKAELGQPAPKGLARSMSMGHREGSPDLPQTPHDS